MAKNRITLNVLANITKKVSDKNVVDPENIVLVVFTGSNIELNKRIEELKGLKDKGMMFSLAFSFMAERILNVNYICNLLNPIEVYKEENIFQLEEIVEKYYAIIGPNITTNTISKVSLGMVDSFVSSLIWTFLYNEKPVYLDFTSVKNYLGIPSSNKAINKIINNHIETLDDMGVIEIEPDKYLGKIRVTQISDVRKTSRVNNDFKKVVTESDLKDVQRGERLILPKGTIITPLAKDKASQLGIKLEIEK